VRLARHIRAPTSSVVFSASWSSGPGLLTPVLWSVRIGASSALAAHGWSNLYLVSEGGNAQASGGPLLAHVLEHRRPA